MQSMLLSFIVKFVLYFSCEKNENKQKEVVGFGPYKNFSSDNEEENELHMTVRPSNCVSEQCDRIRQFLKVLVN